ncbi:MAG TPA: deoxyribose-phosphate aldolase [Terriglobales bacterium]|nr:deoxyribose-phosphate aldolase [Terriglobales bacterium]
MIVLAPNEYAALVNSILESIPKAAPEPVSALAQSDLASAIESTLLVADATSEQIAQLCDDAESWGLAAVCVNPCWVAMAAARLRPTKVRVATVVGFPLGAGLAVSKRNEAAECLKLGADELDMVINIGALKSGADEQVGADIRGVAELAHEAGARVKVILEMAYLSRDEQQRACRLALAAGADYIKTSTGFARSGATVEDVAFLRSTIAGQARIKAAGGIRTRAQAEALLAAGAHRIGTSAARAILG